jgi:molybdenum cofactor cytidylyltransferase
VIRYVVHAALHSPVDEVVVVLGHAAEDVRRALPPSDRVRPVVNPDYERGQSTSLRTGLNAMGLDARAVVILLGDQPGISTAAVEAVVDAWRRGGGPVVRAAYSGQPGHPTLCDRLVWPELQRIEGDAGVRAALVDHPEWVTTVELGGQVPGDIDTEEDYIRVRESFAGP